MKNGNKEHHSITNSPWKHKFPALINGLRMRLDNCVSLIDATAVLHNLILLMKIEDNDEDPEEDTDGDPEEEDPEEDRE